VCGPDPRRRDPRPRRLAAAAGLLATAALAGCSSDAPPALGGSGATTTAAVPATTTPAPTPAGPGALLVVVTTTPPADAGSGRVFADYVAFWQRDMLALRTNDVQRSGVLDYLFPPQTATTIDYIAGRRRSGVRTDGVLRIAPTAPTVSGRSAFLRDCLDQTGVVDVDRSGRRTTVRARSPLSVALVMGTDRRWRVSRLTTVTDPNCR